MRKLGDTQRHVLWSLVTNNAGDWYPGAGWYWGNTSTTIRIMNSLVNRGLVTREMRRDLNRTPARVYPYYKITDEGRKLAGPPDVLPARSKRS